jgi:two-component system, NarL family, invasion response regulator UvrY
VSRPADPGAFGVLVVDDQRPFRAAARGLLATADRLTVVGEATSGEEGVELAARLRPKVVLMDVRLPGIDGIEATRRILAIAPRTLVVLVSTHRQADLPPGWATCGAAAFLRKEDFSVEALGALVASE